MRNPPPRPRRPSLYPTGSDEPPHDHARQSDENPILAHRHHQLHAGIVVVMFRLLLGAPSEADQFTMTTGLAVGRRLLLRVDGPVRLPWNVVPSVDPNSNRDTLNGTILLNPIGLEVDTSCIHR